MKKTGKIPQTIILAAGNQLPDANFNSQMIPLRGRPALAWVVDGAGSGDIHIVLDKNNILLLKYLKSWRKDLDLVTVDKTETFSGSGNFTILDSLYAGLEALKNDTGAVRILLGDTLCREFENSQDDFFLVSEDFITSKRWCLVQEDKNGFAEKFYDKLPDIETAGKKALIGYYGFSDLKLLKKTAGECLRAGAGNISDLLCEYSKTIPLKCVKAAKWIDLGHKAGLIKARNSLYNSRCFNYFRTDSPLGTLTKISANKKKLEDEYFWYRNMPDGLRQFAPQILGFRENAGKSEIKMELCGYPVLSELFILGNLNLEEWELIIRRLFEVHRLMETYEGTEKEDYEELYLGKTRRRLAELRSQAPCWDEILGYDTLEINGRKYKNLPRFSSDIETEAAKIIKNARTTFIHGDYCFSNILFDTNSLAVKLIDPKGRIKRRSVYGDPRYDIAKLRHSAEGKYDFAVHGLFGLEENGNVFKTEEFRPELQEDITRIFDSAAVEFGWDIREIIFIEALLFASMIPLHSEDIKRQKLFYLKAVKRINDFFRE